MFEDVEPTAGRGELLTRLTREDLDLHSVEELDARIDALKAEIVRAEQVRDSKRSRKSAADALFSFKT